MIARYMSPAIGVAAATFVLLFVILSVPLWIAFVATGGAIGVYLVGAGTVLLGSQAGISPTRELAAAPLTAGGLLSAAGALVVMYVVLGIPLWVSVLGGFGVLAAVAVAESLVSVATSPVPRTGTRAERFVDSGRARRAEHTSPNGDADRPRHREPAAA